MRKWKKALLQTHGSVNLEGVKIRKEFFQTILHMQTKGKVAVLSMG